MHWEHDIGGEGCGGDFRGAVVQQKAQAVASKGRSLPLYTKWGKLDYFDLVTHSTTHPSPGTIGSYLWESTSNLLLDS
eukprot:4098805-Ditylum_brightwellii.AAC.1